MTELIDDPEDYCPADYAVMAVLATAKRPQSKSAIMRDCIKKYGDLIEHGPYLYGEYSDDIDEAIEGLCADGILHRAKEGTAYRISITEYGRALFDRFLHSPIEDEDLEAMKEAILGGLWE